MKWEDEVLKAMGEMVAKGGEMQIVVIKREQERIVIIKKYPENQIICDKVVLTE